MRAQKLPAIGEWYQDSELGLFRIIAVDEDSATIERQYADGDIDEIDFDNWRSASYRSASEPDDMKLAFDDEEEEDSGLLENKFDRTHGRPWEEVEHDVFSFL